MPWRETNPMEQRKEFINKFLTGQWTMAELTDRFGISRVTGYKWWERFKAKGLDGLEELSRAPHSCPHRTSPEIEAELSPVLKKCGILAFRRASSGTMTSVRWMAPAPVDRPNLRTKRGISEETDWASTTETAEFWAVPSVAGTVLPSS